MTTTIDVRDLSSQFASLLSQAAAGAEVIVTDGAVAKARLVPLTAAGPRIPGLHFGSIQTAADFDAPMPD